ncbi:MAG: GntR family transcriptional regulator [Vallitalea sp.]|jgi:DNA-binding GntR family transcriptional regulator|nr:GntR family transcriptional regulator [Vallitalea sp.]
MAKKIAHYKIIENDILQKIKSNEYKENQLIPTELELTKTYNVSRVTVRRATDNLVANGYLKRTPGLGTIVTANKKTSVDPHVKGFGKQMKELGKTPLSIVNTFIIEKANKTNADILGINEGDRLYYIERIRKADNNVYLLEVSYISVDKFPELSISYLQKSKFDFFQKVKGITIHHQNHVVKPILSDQRLSDIFKIKLNTPILMVENYIFSSDDTIIDFSRNFYNPTKYELSYIKYT